MDEFQKELLNVLNRIANSLQASEPAPVSSTPPEQPKLSLEEVRAILAEKSRAGFTAQIQQLLEKYGANRLSKIDPVHYRALVKDVEELK
ncbi:DNA ligase [Allobaculum fili]|uniref:DNA ligase n=1 Tax=Allobaculum fili TaxID=2834460 RepID=UPI001E375824|nr:DNA ligase [Allobaculum fili]